MPMSEEYVRKLQFPQMVAENSDNHETAFTVVKRAKSFVLAAYLVRVRQINHPLYSSASIE